jgi:hypothetical protein
MDWGSFSLGCAFGVLIGVVMVFGYMIMLARPQIREAARKAREGRKG